MYSESFQNFLIEASLASSSIRGGLTSLQNCTITNKGTFYSAFFQLSVGVERFFKIIYILDYMIHHKLRKPEFNEIRTLGHDIKSLHLAASKILEQHSENCEDKTTTDIQNDIINLLSEFGDQSRYHVLNTITKSKKETPDPLKLWSDILESGFWEYFTPRKREKVVDDTIKIVSKSGRYTYSQFFSLDGFLMSDVDFLVLEWKIKNVTPYLVSDVVSILYPYYDLLCTLREKIFIIDQAKGGRELPIPYIEELFPYLLTDPPQARKRKNWLK